MENDNTNINKALNTAVQAIYFNDNSDYLSALYTIVRNLTGEQDLDEDRIKVLFDKINSNDEHIEPWMHITNWNSVNSHCYLNVSRSATVNSEEVANIELCKYKVREGLSTKKQAKQILAFSMLTQIHKAILDWTTQVDTMNSTVYGINLRDDGQYNYTRIVSNIEPIKCTPFEIEFYKESQRSHFIKHNQYLINQYLGKQSI